MVKDNAFIYQSKKDEKKVYRESLDEIYRIFTKSGKTPLVFLSYVKFGELGRRQFLGEIKSGQVIPSVKYEDDEGIVWQLFILAADTLIIERKNHIDYEKVCKTFANDIGLMNYERLDVVYCMM